MAKTYKPSGSGTVKKAAVRKSSLIPAVKIIKDGNTIMVQPRLFRKNKRIIKLPVWLIDSSTAAKASIADIYLGGKKNLGIKNPLQTEDDYIRLIRKGIRKTSVDHLIAATSISADEMAEILQISDEELQKIKPDQILEQDQSEKAVNIARLYASGEEAFGSVKEFSRWMNGRIPSLGNKRPKEYLDTTSGINLLMDEITRIQHGVYS
jgi:putative toxin-antitoxin system antitoxin component (TIGR02293 family)